MGSASRNLSPARAAARLGVSIKALRLYERSGLIAPGRSAVGWRLYSPADMARAAEIVALRTLGIGLADMARHLDGGADDLAARLAAQDGKLRDQARSIAVARANLRTRRQASANVPAPIVLPWPWEGETFDLSALRPLTFLTGPLGSGKTRLAERLAAELPGALYLGPDRRAAAPSARVDQAMDVLAARGAERSDALRALVDALDRDAPSTFVIDMVEDGLSTASQRALVAHLRAGGRNGHMLILMTRSTAILDCDLVAPDEAIILCAANHGPPLFVEPWPGGHGYEALATCLADPAVRARTAGVIAMRMTIGA
ncbi:MerR family transcriptional regulator [Sphingomonas sp. BIUV-7]|uniref:MerR family transcriptional regulator n=1 Tax=Sphingomonas natans TaxID=3063330 RepID=A0ABT8Y4S0_9SPHN|nr:MerR family transcriptional regulator [Sphingomonas sp. BIUV-7]MDO6412992.1 MerR family transcriptional regulator [Sphingomonas sp. BIUV-7]